MIKNILAIIGGVTIVVVLFICYVLYHIGNMSCIQSGIC